MSASGQHFLEPFVLDTPPPSSTALAKLSGPRHWALVAVAGPGTRGRGGFNGIAWRVEAVQA